MQAVIVAAAVCCYDLILYWKRALTNAPLVIVCIRNYWGFFQLHSYLFLLTLSVMQVISK